jgi:hypothetical protein
MADSKLATLDTLISFLGEVHGCDRAWMMIQFGSKLIGSLVARQMGAGNPITTRLSQVEQNVNWARYAARFWGTFLAINLWKQSRGEKDTLRKYLMKIDSLVLILLNPAQHASWVAAYCPGLIPNKKQLGRASLCVLLVHLGLYQTLNFLKYRGLQRKEEEVAAEKGDDDDAVVALRGQRSDLALKMLSSTCDSIIVFNGTHLLEAVRVPGEIVGLLGLVSACTSGYVAWKHVVKAQKEKALARKVAPPKRVQCIL